MKKNKGFASIAVIGIIVLVVGLIGIALLKNIYAPKVGIPIPTTTPTPNALSATSSSSTILDTATWKTYKNDKFGFEFKYPIERILENTKIGDCFYVISNGAGPVFCIDEIDNKNNLSLDDWWIINGRKKDLISDGSLIIGNLTANKYISPPDEFPETEIIFKKGIIIFKFTGTDVPPGTLSTFKFIEPAKTP